MTLVQSELQSAYLWSNQITKIYRWSTQIRPAWWTPWANTLAYYPLTSVTQLTDQSWNSRTLSKNKWTTPTFGTYGWVNCMYTASAVDLRNANISIAGTAQTTVSWWYYKTANPNNDNGYMFGFFAWEDTMFNNITWGKGLRSLYWPFMRCKNNVRTASAWQLTWWHHYVASRNGSSWSFYCDGVLVWTLSWAADTTITADHIKISSYTSYERSSFWYFSNVIFENVAWSAQDVSDYFDLTKWDYWIVNLQNITPISPDIIPDTPNNWTWDVLTI